ncbi:MAG: hypothetical protein DME80_05755 [Verrucomicrobia bacterium]|nr:MAG: hypothetical protein DME89_02955 [Verrucomicrobiota bacterium]PYJ44596.1 MAG: hypothetical protein DME80_05755 [Verrucomicrobiota bacterium]
MRGFFFTSGFRRTTLARFIFNFGYARPRTTPPSRSNLSQKANFLRELRKICKARLFPPHLSWAK